MHPSISNLTFGAEFEILSPISRADAGRRISEITGLPVFSAIGRAPAGSWSIVADGSIRGTGHPLEFVSPVLKGQAGLDQIRKVADALLAIGCSVNSTTGFHVHVGAPTSRIDFFKDLLKLYGRYEEAIDSFMPPSRRANEATYCKSVRLINPAAIDRATTVPELSHALQRASGAAGSRYHKVNLDSYAKHGTVEFRQHAGTVKAHKAINWINTCMRIVALAAQGQTGVGTAQRVAWDLARLAGKQAHCAQLIARPEGATNEEIRLAFGYRTISARKQLKDANLSFREEKHAGKTRFFAAASGTTVAYPATLEGLADLIEATPEQREWLAGRVTETAPR
jgi:Putative amidoligase enzyme